MELAIGFITYNDLTAKYLPYFLPSLFKSDFNNFKVLVADNSDQEENGNKNYIKENYPEIDFQWTGGNQGFAKAYNILIRQAKAQGAEYFLMLNPDMLIEPVMISKLIFELENNSDAGAAIPKILQWDYKKGIAGKTNKIDSCGLIITQELRFYDSEQGQDDGKIARSIVFGFTGAAALFKIKALADVAYENEEYFDELFFMYKEDCDLSCRLQLAGWSIILQPEAVCYHDRSVAAIGKSFLGVIVNRRKKSKNVRRWSFLNQSIIYLKYKDLPFLKKIKHKIIFYQFKMIVYAFIIEPSLIKEIIKLFKIKKNIYQKKKQHKIRIDIKRIQDFMKK